MVKIKHYNLPKKKKKLNITMSSQFCFVCHNNDISDKTEDIREKYNEVTGLALFPDCQLCYVCCHLLNKLWIFRSICLKQSLVYPELISQNGLLKLQKNEVQCSIICSENDCISNSGDIENLYNFNTNIIIQSYSKSENDNLNVKLEIIDSDNDTTKDYDSDISQNRDLDIKFNINNSVNEDNIDNEKDIPNDITEATDTHKINGHNDDTNKIKIKKKRKIKEKKTFKKTVLSTDEQKMCLENMRKEKKYIESEFKCYNCATGFLFKDTYQAHMMRHEESNGEFLCPICTLRFASSSVLRAHKSTHSHRYTCTVCNQPVRGKARKTHADRCHRGVTVNANCHLCGGVFKDLTALQQHVRRSHHWKSQHRRHACGVCGDQCPNHAALRTHMMKHLKRFFPCDKCKSTFSSPYRLTQHKKNKHTSNDEIQLFYCELCNVNFSNKKGLMAHKRNTVKHQQTYAECEICYRVLTTRRALLRHVQSVHCLNKPGRSKNVVQLAICHVCGHAFKGKSKLTRHLKKVCEKSKFEEPPIYQPDYSYYYENNDFMNL